MTKIDIDHILRERDATFALMLARAEKAEAEVERLKSELNDIDLCQHGQAPCAYSLRLDAERNAALAEVERLEAVQERLCVTLREIARETYTDNIGDRWPTRGATIARAAIGDKGAAP